MTKRLDKKILLVAAVALMLATGLIWLAFFWQFGKIKKISDDIQKEQLDSQVKQGRSQKILELGKELGDIDSREKEMKAMYVNKEDAVPFLKLLESIATGTNNSIIINVSDLTKLKTQTSSKPAASSSDAATAADVQKETQAQKTTAAKKSGPDYSNQLGFSLELTGNYGTLVDFMTKMESLPFLVKVYTFQTIPAPKSYLCSNNANCRASRSAKSAARRK